MVDAIVDSPQMSCAQRCPLVPFDLPVHHAATPTALHRG